MNVHGYTSPPMNKFTPKVRTGNRLEDAIQRLTERGLTGSIIKQKIIEGDNPFKDKKPTNLFVLSELLIYTAKRNQTLTRAFLLGAMGKLSPNERAASAAVSFALKVFCELNVIHIEQERITIA